MTRRDRTGEHVIYHPLYQKWMEEHPDEEPPKHFVSANDLTPDEHVKVQALVQEYTDSSISIAAISLISHCTTSDDGAATE
ncbi:MAG: hypothetical protein IID17_01550 [Nitrospinae bacterium]|nr:hypothetical protein [Nitrospinota bacterium]